MADHTWKPRAIPPLGHDLTEAQRLACVLRILGSDGFSENLAGHITVIDGDDNTMLVNPWGLWWNEVATSDLCRIDADGEILEGAWDVTPAINIHTELHRAQPDAKVVIHNHPYWSTVLAAVGHLPEIFHQTGCLYDGDLVFVDEYGGEIATADEGASLAAHIGDAPVSLLANHGVIVTAPNLELALYRAASFDRQCRLAYDVLLAKPDARPIPVETRPLLKRSLVERAAEVYFAGAVRTLLKTEPDVLQ